MKHARSRSEAISFGMKTYNTGTPCKRGHLSDRVTKNSDCIECRNERSAKYRSENRDEFIEYLRDWRAKNPYAFKDYYQDNIDQLRERSRNYQRENPERRKENWKKWYSKNRGRAIENASRRRALIIGAEGSFDKDDISKIMTNQNNRCAEPSCRVNLNDVEYHVDHIFPLSKGGSNWPSNLQILCKTCNLRKAACLPEEWAKRNGRLI